jgi:hypothetical protein
MIVESELDLRAELLRLSGLSALLGPGVLRRALADVGADPANPTPVDYLKALPQLEARMRAYLPPADVEVRLQQIRRLLHR